MFLYGILFSALCILILALEPLEVQFEWDYAYLQAPRGMTYVIHSSKLGHIKFWNGSIYLAIPRVKGGVPVTLAVAQASPMDESPLLKPYPNWKSQNATGSCSSFQSVMSIEIDPMGRMWVLDSGTYVLLPFNTTKKIVCPPRLVILDLKCRGKVLLNYTFPPSVARPGSALLSDIVLDHEGGGFAYISNLDIHDDNDKDIIVFSLRKVASWKVKQNDRIDRLALAPARGEGNRLLYYTTLNSQKIFTLPTHVLKDQIRQEANELSETPRQWHGMAISSNGTMYLTESDTNSVYSWKLSSPSFDATELKTEWTVDSSTRFYSSPVFDGKGNLLLVCYTDWNVRVIRLSSEIKMQNYQYCENGSMPELPSITFGALKNGTVSTLFTIAAGGASANGTVPKLSFNTTDMVRNGTPLKLRFINDYFLLFCLLFLVVR
ncbi:protein yellow-like [Copidosoma floridanum]|uniref:protein yellow-like n=1 Tax=Copidosoma floridanum TaxID=29053 RepID=UPI0006C9A47C|nr:protein yellow-like [Copidosoma floridanum]